MKKIIKIPDYKKQKDLLNKHLILKSIDNKFDYSGRGKFELVKRIIFYQSFSFVITVYRRYDKKDFSRYRSYSVNITPTKTTRETLDDIDDITLNWTKRDIYKCYIDDAVNELLSNLQEEIDDLGMYVDDCVANWGSEIENLEIEIKENQVEIDEYKEYIEKVEKVRQRWENAKKNTKSTNKKGN